MVESAGNYSLGDEWGFCGSPWPSCNFPEVLGREGLDTDGDLPPQPSLPLAILMDSQGPSAITETSFPLSLSHSLCQTPVNKADLLSIAVTTIIA